MNDLVKFQSHINQLLRTAGAETNYPPYNAYILEDESLVIELAATGFQEDELSVTFDGSYLEVSGKKTSPKTEVKEFLVRQLAYRNFDKAFNITGAYELEYTNLFNGILRVSFKPTTKKLKAEIKVGRPSQLFQAVGTITT